MPFDFQTFRTRAVTAIVFVLVMLGGILIDQWTFLLLFTIIHFGCWYEYQKLVGLIDSDYRNISWPHKYGIMVVGWGFMLYMAPDPANPSLSLHSIGWWIFSYGMILFGLTVIFFMFRGKARILAHSLMGLVYISLSWGLMMQLWGNMNQTVFQGPNWIMPLLLIASIWINDTMAYLVGSFIGKTPFSAISPKKTWEGTGGGAILTVVAVVLAGHYIFHLPIKPLLLISITAAVAGTAGDLLESKLKRLAGVKDSGRMMPGHGGFLDRFDSLLLATTCVWAIFYLFS